jgi:hypothetical protein
MTRTGTLRRNARAWIAAMIALIGFCGAVQAADDDSQPTVTPYRPTVSNPADLPVPGWLEAEFGALRMFGDDRSRSDSAPWLLKYAFDENHGVLLGGDAFVSSRMPDAPTRHSIGDTFLEWKQRFALTDKAVFGIEAGVVAPTAGRDFGVGKPQWLVNGIFSDDLGALHLDVNVGEAHGGEHPAGVSPWQTTWAAAVSAPLAGNWGGAFELSGMRQRGAATQSEALLALSYNVSHRLALDAGTAYSLARSAHGRSVFAGATLLLGRLR